MLRWKRLFRRIEQAETPVVNHHAFQPGVFVGEWQWPNDDSLPDGYTGWMIVDDYWNGWATPWFERDVADRILHDHASVISYDAQRDAYLIHDAWDNHDDHLAFYGCLIEVPGGEVKKVYPIGRYHWTWMERDRGQNA